MKKIIYSFVIMIAAGSLFTSCVTNTEPQGIKDIRQAKADYIDALSNLKKAEAEKVKAEAAYQDALTAYQNAQTALVEADVKAKEIRNSVLDAKAQAEIEKTLAAAELAAVEAAKKLALAEFDLQKTLGDIAVWSEELTPAEQIAIKIYTDAYNDFIAAEQAVRAAEAKVYYSDLKYAEAVQELRIDTAKQAGIIEANVIALNNLPDSGASESEIQAFFKKFDQEKTEAEYALANIDAEWNYYRQTEVAENIKGFATELSEWVVKNAALPAPYAVHFKAELPDNDQVNKLLKGYLHNDNIVVDPENKAIAANFYSIPSAEDGLEALNTVVSALSRELVVDSTKYYGRVDTTGMSVVLAKKWKEYDDVLAALKAGVEAYEPVVDAKDALEAAEEDLEAAKEDLEAAEDAYEADKAELKAAIENFVTVWNDIATDNEKMAKNDTTDLWNAFKKVIDVRKKVFSKDSEFLYKKGYKADKTTIDTGKVNFADLTKDMLAGDNKDVKALNDKETGGSETALSDAINQFFGCKYLRNKFDVSSGKLFAITYADLHDASNTEEGTHNFEKTFFGHYWAHADFAEIYITGNGVYAPAAVTEAIDALADATTAVDDAKTDLSNAYEKYYTEIYCKFWGLKLEDVYDAATCKLKEDVDSLVVNFTKETFTKEYPIVSFFTWTGQQFYNAKDSTFKVPSYLFIQGDEELAIVMTQLKANQGWPEDFHLHKLLLTEALWCQYAADNYSIGSEGTKKALARLTEISDELFVEIIATLAKQVEDSKPFFEFVENLIGKECLDGIFARIDSAATVAAQFEETTTEPGESYLKQIAAGKLTSKELFTMFFEEFMCGSGVDNTYRTAYEHMQIAKAFTGEEFADLVSDVIAAFIDASEINLTGKGNIIEKILFGTVEKVTWKETETAFENAFKIVAPVVGPFLTSNFGGKIAELQVKYFTEWKEKWAEYDVARAIVNAKLEQLATEAGVVIEYAKDIKGLLLRAKIYEHNIEVAIERYTKDCETLAAIEAGADWRSLLKEKIEDELAKAIVALEAAKVKLDAAYEAYKQVLANHNLAQ